MSSKICPVPVSVSSPVLVMKDVLAQSRECCKEQNCSFPSLPKSSGRGFTRKPFAASCPASQPRTPQSPAPAANPNEQALHPPGWGCWQHSPHTQSWGHPPSCHLHGSRCMTRVGDCDGSRVWGPQPRAGSERARALSPLERVCLCLTVVPSRCLSSTSWGPQLCCCCCCCRSKGSSRPAQVFDLPAGRLGLSCGYRRF